MSGTPKSSDVRDTVHYAIEDRDRLGRLENEVENLQSGFNDLRKDMRDGFERLGQAISRQADKVESGSRTNWSLVIVAFGTVFTLITAGASLTVMYVNHSLAPSELAIQHLADSDSQHRSNLSVVQTSMQNAINEKLQSFSTITQERKHAFDYQLEASERSDQRIQARLEQHEELIIKSREDLAAIKATIGQSATN